ncbi:MAG: GNAT family protein [Alphaproteobacteria bacterium]
MIRGSTFLLRTVMEKDLDELVGLVGDVSRQGDYLPVQLVSQSHLREAFEKDGLWSENFKRLLIVGDDEKIIGSLWMFKPVPYFDAFEIGYTLYDRESWGKGLMTEAAGLVVDYLFMSSRVNRLEIRCDVENRASARIAEKLGFTHEGIARQATFARGRHHDMHQFALLRSDWVGGAAKPDRGK